MDHGVIKTADAINVRKYWIYLLNNPHQQTRQLKAGVNKIQYTMKRNKHHLQIYKPNNHQRVVSPEALSTSLDRLMSVHDISEHTSGFTALKGLGLKTIEHWELEISLSQERQVYAYHLLRT